MKFNKLEFWVGCFMLAGLGAMLALALQVAGLSFKSEGDSYRVFAHFDNIGSIKVRAPIKVGGVVIGRIEAIELDPKNQLPKVTLSLQKNAGEFSTSSRLSIQTSGLLGEQYISLTPGFTDEEMGIGALKEGDQIEDTKSAVVLEDLIGQFLYRSNSSNDSSKEPPSTPKP